MFKHFSCSIVLMINKSFIMKNIKSTYYLLQLIILFSFIGLSNIQSKETIYLSEQPLSQKKIAVVTNRAIIHMNPDSIQFDSNIDQFDMKASFLTASYGQGDWIYTHNNSLTDLLNQKFEHENWVIFVHGDGKDLRSAINRAKEIKELHQVNVLVYAWPSHNPEFNGIKNFKNSYANVEKATVHFSKFLSEVANIRKAFPQTSFTRNLSMFLHSLGNYYLENLVKSDLHTELTEPFIDNLIINAAAVDLKAHDEWVEQLRFQKRIYINSNGKDMNLIGLRIFSSKKMQLGEDPEPPLASNAYYVSFTDAVGASIPPGPSHSYFFA
jgi:hypothetical protein